MALNASAIGHIDKRAPVCNTYANMALAVGLESLEEVRRQVRRSIRSEWESRHVPTPVVRLRVRRQPRTPRRSRNAELREQGLAHCHRCDQDKPLSEFRSNGYCLVCARAYDKAADEARRERRVNPTRLCPTCQQTKPDREFPRGSGRHRCLECIASPPAPKRLSREEKLRRRRQRLVRSLAAVDAELRSLSG